MHDSCHTLVDVERFFLSKVEDGEGIVGEFQILVVVYGWYACLSLTDVVVVIDVIAEVADFLDFWYCLLHHLVKDVVRALYFLLESDS